MRLPLVLETKDFLTKITNDLGKNVEFRDGMGLRLVNGIPCLSAFSGVDRGGHH